MKLRVGLSLVSPVDTTTVIVVRAPSSDVELTCAGVPMTAKGQPAPDDVVADPTQMAGTAVGKRYADESIGLELLCTKAGEGTLACDGSPIPYREAKALPTSD